jgi:hypothetical protein
MPIGLITLDVKLAGKPDAGKPHVRFDVAVAGNGVDDPLEGDHSPERGETAWPHKVCTATAPASDPTVIKRGGRIMSEFYKN